MRSPALTLALALVLSGAPALAHARPTLRRAPAAAAAAAAEAEGPSKAARRSFASPHETSGFCASDPDALGGVIEAHASRPEFRALPTHFSTDVGEIAVLEDDGSFFYTFDNGANKVDLMAVSRAFYRTHGDDYDILALFLASGVSDWLGSPTAFAASFVIRNDIGGIGLSNFDEGDAFGSPSRLGAILSMNGLHQYPSDPFTDVPGSAEMHSLDALGHEMAHRWLSYVYVDSAGHSVRSLLGRGRAHWNFFFDSDASIMEGCDWVTLPPDSFRTTSVSQKFGRMDQYLMGLRPGSSVGPFLKVNSPTDPQPPGTYGPAAIPIPGFGCRGVGTLYTVDDIANAEGPRVPDPSVAPHQFRMAIALVIPNGAPASPADLAKLEAIRAPFPAWFQGATEGLGTCDVTLDSRAGAVRIAHTPLSDTENGVTPRAVRAFVGIEAGGIPIAVDPGSVRFNHRTVGGGPFNPVPMSLESPDTFSVSLAFPPGSYEYFLSASSDSVGITATDPSTAPLQLHTFRVGPDVTPPSVVHVPVPTQAAFRLPQRLLARVSDNLALAEVRVEFTLNGGPLQSVAAGSVGRDSFATSLGGGLVLGDRLAYRFVARDASLAANLGFSNPGFDTLHVTRDGIEQWENGTVGFYHIPAIYSYRDAWHPRIEPFDLSRGSVMHCGEPSGEAYAPHLDAALYTPSLAAIPPQARLEITHRYDLEDAGPGFAWDPALAEYSTDGSNWLPLTPVGGYTNQLYSKVSTVLSGRPCWGGNSGGWRTDVFHLATLAPGPLTVRFRMVTDTFFGREGWSIDRVSFVWADGVTDVPLSSDAPQVSIAPNPARDRVTLAFESPRRDQVSWELFDLAGRRVATLWRGVIAAGPARLEANVPRSLGAGLYFARVSSGGRVLRSDRVAIVR